MILSARAMAASTTGAVATRAGGCRRGSRSTDRSWTVNTYGTRVRNGAAALV